MNRWHISVGCVLALGATLTHAETERERIAAERAAVNARYAEQEHACQERFIVTSCVEAARKEQRMTLTRLHRAELVLDETDRREAAARRRQAMSDKAAVQAARASDPIVTIRRENPRAAPSPMAAASSPLHESVTGVAHQPVSDAERQAREQKSEANFQARAQAAQRHREAVERRNAERAAEGKTVAPLPSPASPAR